MKSKKYSLIDSMVIGIGIGIPVTLVCMTLIGGFNDYIREFLIWTAASAIFGLITTLVFGIKKDISLLVALPVHCLGCLIVATAAGAICGYADSFLSLLLGILPVFIVVYIIAYVVIVLRMKAEEKQINKELEKK